MSSRIQETDLSPKKAIETIWNRLHGAVEKAKHHAENEAKTEAVMESALDADDEYGDDISFEDVATVPADDDEYGDDLSFETGDNVAVTKDGGKDTSVQNQKTFAKRPKSRDERELLQQQADEFLRQRDAEWTYSVAEIRDELKRMFSYADENREYLKNAGHIITEPEVRAIFNAEYKNYQDKELSRDTMVAIEHIPEILRNRMKWFVERLDERLHGKGDFLRKGSIMGYLLAMSRRANVARVPLFREGARLVIKDAVSDEKKGGVSQFILADDLKECEGWLKKRFAGYDLSDESIASLALDILANGTNKDEIVQKLGGRTGLPKKYQTPAYFSIERDGDDVAMIGPESGLERFNKLFDKYMDREDKSGSRLGTDIVPATKVGLKKFHGNVHVSKYDERKYLPRINQLVRDGLIVPVTFGAGEKSIEGMGSGKGGDNEGKESRAGENILQHRAEAGMSVIDSGVGERFAANGVIKQLRENMPGVTKVAGLADAENELDAVKKTIDTGTLAGLSAKVLKWVGDEAKIPYSIEVRNGIPYVVFDTEKSIVAKASKELGLDGSTRPVILAMDLFNKAIENRFTGIKEGKDISDIPGMAPEEIRSSAMPVIQLGNLAERCFMALYRKGIGSDGNGADNGDPLVAFGKGYLEYMMGAMFELDTETPSLISSAGMFSKIMSVPHMSVAMIHKKILEMGVLDTVNMANRLDEAAYDIDVGQENGTGVHGEFYRETAVPLDRLARSGILGAVARIIDSSDEKTVTGCIYGAVEILTGIKPGTIGAYMDELDTCADKEAIEEMARTIKRSGNDIIDIQMTDSGRDVVREVPATAARAVTKSTGRPRMLGRNRF